MWMARNFRSRTLHVTTGGAGNSSCGWRAISDHVHSLTTSHCAKETVVDGAQFPITYTRRHGGLSRRHRCGWRAISDHVHSALTTSKTINKLWMARNFRSRTLRDCTACWNRSVVDGAQFPITYTPAIDPSADPIGCGWRAISDHVHSHREQGCEPKQLWMARNFRSRTLPDNFPVTPGTVVDGAQFPITYTR